MRAAIEVADIFRAAGPAYRTAHAGHLGLNELKVMSAIESCRTAALGGHVEACTDCGHQRIAYNSCRNRHCPRCQGAADPFEGFPGLANNLLVRSHGPFGGHARGVGLERHICGELPLTLRGAVEAGRSTDILVSVAS